jgi:hypothetical protein
VMQARGRIELFVRAAETEFQDEVLRGGVGGVVAGEEGFGAGFFEGERDYRSGRFFGQAATPTGRSQMNA